MGKNNRLINAMKALADRNREIAVNRAADDMVPQIYAALALALHREYGWGYSRINHLFVKSQEIWENFSGSGEDMLALCEEETGISMVLGEE